MDLKLKDVEVFISASYRGTGLATAKAFVAEGARVIVHGFSEEQAEQGMQSSGAAGFVYGEFDEQLIAQIQTKASNLQVLINNYGTAEPGKWQLSDSAAWLSAYEKNVLSAVTLINGLLPVLKQQSFARIIQLSTVGALRPNRIMPQYYAAKAALSNLTVSLARELSGSKITVNTVSPGIIHTPEIEMLYTMKAKKKGWGDEWADIEKAAVANDFPNFCERMAKPEELADLLCFLASPRAAYINGQQLRVDGGFVDTV